MRLQRFALAISMVSVSMAPTNGQGFVNLDFESARVTPVTVGQGGSLVPIADALPGWSGAVGDKPAETVLYDNFYLGTATLTLIGPHFTDAAPYIEGRYTAILQIGSRLGDGVYAAPSLFQTGVIPFWAQSIRLKAADLNRLYSVTDELAVSIGGQQISMQPIGGNSDYTLFAGDITRFAGTTSELKLSGVVSLEHQYRNVAIDSIEFSTEPVPEPST